MKNDLSRSEALKEALKIIEPQRELALTIKSLMKQSEIERALGATESAQRALNSAFRDNQMLTEALRVSNLETSLNWSEALNACGDLQTHIREDFLYLQQAFTPTISLIQQISVDLAHAIKPYHGIFDEATQWQESLAKRMNSISSSWAFEANIELSSVGFARLARISDAVHSNSAYDEYVSDLLNEELGSGSEHDDVIDPIERDANAITAGLRSELIAFPRSAYGDVVYAAGFRFELTTTTPPQAINCADPGALFDPQHYTLLLTIEQSLRQTVELKLHQLEGEAWMKRRVSADVLTKWSERQTEEQDNGRPVYSLIQYADFMDMADIICRKDNWRDAFSPIFKNREDFRVSLTRLHPVRKACAHVRPIGRADVLTLVSEGTRVLKALGVARLIL